MTIFPRKSIKNYFLFCEMNEKIWKKNLYLEKYFRKKLFVNKDETTIEVNADLLIEKKNFTKNFMFIHRIAFWHFIRSNQQHLTT